MPKEKRVKEFRESRVKGNSFGASGFTLGIMSILSLGYIGIIMSVLGFFFCYVQWKGKKTKLAKAGLIINIIGFVISILWIVYLAPLFTSYIQQLPTA